MLYKSNGNGNTGENVVDILLEFLYIHIYVYIFFVNSHSSFPFMLISTFYTMILIFQTSDDDIYADNHVLCSYDFQVKKLIMN